MPPTKDRQALIQHMLTALETPRLPLTKWEENFVESLTEQFERRKSLSDRQLEILDRIYSEKTA
jgi:hypothetical protein